MPNEARKRGNFLGGTLSAAAGAADTTLASAGFAAITGGVSSVEHMAVIVDPNGVDGPPEIVHITALASGGTSATVLRGREGTVARAHAQNAVWRHAPTVADFGIFVQMTAAAYAALAVKDPATLYIIVG